MGIVGEIGMVYTIKNGWCITPIGRWVSKTVNQVTSNGIVASNWGTGLNGGGTVVDHPDFVIEVDSHKNKISLVVISDAVCVHPVPIFHITVVIDIDFSWVFTNRSIGTGMLIHILYKMLNTAPLPYNLIGIRVNLYIAVFQCKLDLGFVRLMLGLVLWGFPPIP